MDDVKTSSESLRPLAWETEFFGFPVAVIHASDATAEELHAALLEARARGVQLVFWPTAQGRRVPHVLIDNFDAQLVDTKVTYSALLAAIAAFQTPAATGVIVQESAPGPATPRLLALARAAGICSRFAMDRRLPPGKADELYEVWMQRSCRRELADVVLVAADSQSGDPLGVVTVAKQADVAQIGLLAVDISERRRGLGTLLLAAAHDWMRSNDIRTAKIVTQAANTPACRLYERTGYILTSEEDYYHFWPQTTEP